MARQGHSLECRGVPSRSCPGECDLSGVDTRCQRRARWIDAPWRRLRAGSVLIVEASGGES